MTLQFDDNLHSSSWQVAGTLWHHKVDEDDALKIIEVVCNAANDEEVNSRLAKAKHVYKSDTPQKEIVGLPTLAKSLNWTEKQVSNLIDALYAVTGRSALPTFTHDFVNRIAYMMKQKKYYDLEDKEMYDGESVDVKYAKHFNSKYTPLKYWKMHPDSKVCVDFTYKPNDPNRFVYGTTKGAVIGLTKSIAADFVKQNIRCNSIAPGTVFSPSWQDRVNQSPDPVQAKKDFIARQPMGRLGTADEIAAVAVYLASDDATFTTGTTISVDGGISI